MLSERTLNDPAVYMRLRGYPDDVVKAAEDLWREAAEAVRQYRATHP